MGSGGLGHKAHNRTDFYTALEIHPCDSLDFSFLFCEKVTLDLAVCRFLGHSDTHFPSWDIFIVVF